MHPVLALLLFVGAPTVEATAPGAAPSDPFSDWLIALTSAVDATHDDPAAGAPRLAAALVDAASHTLALATDASARSRRGAALLSLSRAYLGLGDLPAASAAMDEALRAAGGEPLPADAYGPSLAQLHAERRAALEDAGRGAILVQCRTPCRVYLDERPAPAHARGILLGAYRLYVEATDPAIAPLRQEVALARADQELHILFPPPAAAPEGPLPAEGPTPARPPKTRPRRIAPLWLEGLAIAGGAAAVGAGGALLALDARCVGDPGVTPTPTEPGTCAEIYDTRVGGVASIGAGALVLLGGVVTLAVDGARARRSAVGARASRDGLHLGYALRF